MENLNVVQSIIDLAKENEWLKRAVRDILLYLIAVDKGREPLVMCHDNEEVNSIYKMIDSLKDSANKPTGITRLSIKDIRKQLSNMRITKKQIDATKDQEKMHEYYGYTDCINDLIDWLNKIEGIGTIAK